MPFRAVWETSRVGQEAEAVRGDYGQKPLPWFLKKECVRQGKQLSRLRIGWFEYSRSL